MVRLMLILPSLSLLFFSRVIAIPSNVSPFPPMHWHSWNTFCGENEVNDANMRQMADALVTSGMAAAGYDTVNVVCNGWTGRDPVSHRLQENSTLWPEGISGLAKYLHNKKPPLKLGCYTSPSETNCCKEPGSLGYEALDMETFAQFGCDHVMVDWCGQYRSPADMKSHYEIIGRGIANSSNPNMVYGIWSGGDGKSWKWAAQVGGGYWRTARDLQNSWESLLYNFDTAYSIPGIASYTTPGHHTFLDSMVAGVTPHPGGVPGPGLTMNETVAHVSMWVMAASPLLTCNDVRNMTVEIKNVLTNPEILAVHRDPLVRMAVRIDVGGGVEGGHSVDRESNWSVYGRLLSDNSSAVMILNRGEEPETVILHLEDVGNSMYSSYHIRDLWARADLPGGIFVDQLSIWVPSHGVRLLRMTPVP